MTLALQDNNIPLVCDNPMQNDIFHSVSSGYCNVSEVRPLELTLISVRNKISLLFLY